MILPRRYLVALLLVAACGATAMAKALKFPPIAGELGGDFMPLKVAGAPVVHWTLAVSNGDAGIRHAVLTAEGPGTHLRAEGTLDESGDGTWRVVEGKVDVAPWFAALLPLFGDSFTGASLTGVLQVSGEGSVQKGEIGGRATLSLHDGHLDDPAHKLALEGITLALAFDDIVERRTPPEQTLTWSGGHYDVLALGVGRVVFALAGDEVQVASSTLSAFGGELSLGAFGFSFSRPEISLTARVTGVDVKEFLPLLPPVVSEASGRLDGSIELKHNASGLQIGAGRLTLHEGETAQLRLAPAPGLLSSALPPAVLKYYTGIAGIETGKVPLQADLLEITFTPEGDADGRTAAVHITGGPVDPKLKAPIDLTVNVRGPLETLVKLGTNSRLHFGGGH